MNQIRSSLLMILFIGAFGYGHAQSASDNAIQKDSLLQRINAYLKEGLELSSSQARKLLLLQKAQAYAIETLHSQKNMDEQGKELKKINRLYKDKLKDLFSSMQMDRYKALEEAIKKDLQNRVQEKSAKDRKH